MNVMNIKSRLDRVSSIAHTSSYKPNLAVLMEVTKNSNAFLLINQDKSGSDATICFRLQNMDPYDSPVMRRRLRTNFQDYLVKCNNTPRLFFWNNQKRLCSITIQLLEYAIPPAGTLLFPYLCLFQDKCWKKFIQNDL